MPTWREHIWSLLQSVAFSPRPPHQEQKPIAWLHIPKCGTSFANTLLHYANASLPPDAEVDSVCQPQLGSNTFTLSAGAKSASQTLGLAISTSRCRILLWPSRGHRRSPPCSPHRSPRHSPRHSRYRSSGHALCSCAAAKDGVFSLKVDVNGKLKDFFVKYPNRRWFNGVLNPSDGSFGNHYPISNRCWAEESAMAAIGS